MLLLRQIVALIGGFIVMLVQGSLYIYGTITPYILTYLYYKGDTSLSISDLSIILTLAIIFTNVGIFFSNFKIVSFSNRVTSLIASMGISLSMVALSFSTEFEYYVLLYGPVYGFFIGYGYMAPIKNCYDHLPDRKGLCSGTCLMGFGLGAFFFNFIVVALINPFNESQSQGLFPQGVGNNLPNALRIMGIIYSGIGIVGAVLIQPPQVNELLQQSLIYSTKQEQEKESHFSKKALNIAIDNKLPYLTLILATATPFGMFVAFNYKQYGLLEINDDHYLSIVGSIGSISNGLFRMAWGISMDYFTFRSNIFAMLGTFGIVCLTIVWSVQNKVSYLIAIFLTYCCYGGLNSVFPTQTVRMLGRVLGSKLYYITYIGLSSGIIIQYLAHKFLVGNYGKNGYIYCFMIFGGLLVVSFVLTLLIRFPQHADQKIKGKHRQSSNETNEGYSD